MDFDYKAIIWAITIIMVIYGYYQYIIDTYSWKTKPHLYSWIIFIIMWSLTFLIQSGDGSWPWTWWVGISVLTGIIIAIWALRQRERNITITDTISFSLALISIVLYLLIADPTYSLLLVLGIMVLAYYPTFRKTYYKPWQETLIAFVISGIRHLLSIFAIYHFFFLTLAYPILLVVINIALVWLIIIRRRQLS